MEHTIRNHYLEVTVSEHGAELRSIKDRRGTEYLWQGDPRYWKDRAPTIFPYVARLTEGKYYLDGACYSMPPHGFAPLSDSHPVRSTPAAVSLELTSSEKTRKMYPRDFVFQAVYRLYGRSLLIRYDVRNTDSRRMYFGIGGHPGFRVPVLEGTAFEEYRLRFEPGFCPVRIGFSDRVFLNGDDRPYPLGPDATVPLEHGLFDHDAVILSHMGPRVSLELKNGQKILSVRCPRMRYLGFWHRPHTDAPYVCLEPWSSLPSFQDRIAVFEKQKDLISLEPGRTYRFSWRVDFEAIEA